MSNRKRNVTSGFLILLWALIVAGTVYITSLPEGEQTAATGRPGDLIIYGPEKKRMVTLERKEAIKFGLAEVASTVNYLFVAAAAILSLVGKVTIEPLLSKDGARPLTPSVVMLLRHIAVGCLISIVSGFLARSHFNGLADSESFSIYGAMGAAALCQQVSFAVSALLTTIAIGLLLREIPRREEGVAG